VQAGGTEVVVQRGPSWVAVALWGWCTRRAALGDGCKSFARLVSHIPGAVSSRIPSVALGFVIFGAYASHPFGRAICHVYDWHRDIL